MSGRSSSAPADNGQLFDTSDEGVGAAAAVGSRRGRHPDAGTDAGSADSQIDDGRGCGRRPAPAPAFGDRIGRFLGPDRRTGRRPDPSPARRGGAPRRTPADHRRRGLGQDARPHPSHRPPDGDGRRTALGHSGHHLHQQGGRRDALAGGRARRDGGREDVGLHVPLGLPAHVAGQRRPARFPLELHGLRRHRFATVDRDDHGRARVRPEAIAVARRAGRHQPGQVGTGRLRDVQGRGAERAGSLPEAHR